ncbi:hypothetical protein PV327_004181 [Microctonus hyperodae]|nr:hypothetical protein PV327_004181 [Microctonus hyperodae]
MNSPKQHSPQHTERDRHKPTPPPKPVALAAGQYVYRDLALTPEMYNQLRGLQKKAKDLRQEVRNLRRMSQAQAHTVRETIWDTFITIRAMLLSGGDAAWAAGDTEKIKLSREEDLYKQEMIRLEKDLTELESTVEELRGNVITRKTRVNMSDVENMALILSKSSKTVADLKVRFPSLQEGMKGLLSSEMEKVVREEKFLKEEPDRLESALRRCKKLTGTLVTLKRLASVQEQRLPNAASLDLEETPPITPTSAQHSKAYISLSLCWYNSVLQIPTRQLFSCGMMAAGIGSQVMKSVTSIMFFRNSNLIYRQLQFNIIGKQYKFSTNNVIETTASDENDPAPVFFNNDVQQLLKTLTRADPKKVFRFRKEGKEISDSVYKFMTNEALEAEMKKASHRMEQLLQMPPVVKERTPINSILAKNPEIQGYDTAKYIFTDITYDVKNSDRLIVTREPNGLLRHANWDERFRMNQIYFPIQGRELTPPKMFHGEYLQDLIKREEYEFVLDRACIQYDPDDPEFHRVTKFVYESINNSYMFAKLRSTRHYGPLVFHLVWTKNIDNLLIENIKNDLIEDARLLIQLYNKINKTAKSAEINYDGDDVKYIQQYIDSESPNRGKLTSTINAYKELVAARKVVHDGIKKAHGFE